MSNRTWKITVDEEELKNLIDYHTNMHAAGDYEVARSHRIHDLTKRLNKKDDVEIEKEVEPSADDVKEIAVPSVWD